MTSLDAKPTAEELHAREIDAKILLRELAEICLHAPDPKAVTARGLALTVLDRMGPHPETYGHWPRIRWIVLEYLEVVADDFLKYLAEVSRATADKPQESL